MSADDAPSRRPQHEHYDASQYRAATWSRLKEATGRLARRSTAGRGDAGALAREVGELLDLLTNLERYWAFPGKRACGLLRRQLERSRFGALSHTAARYVRLLISDGYRARNVSEIARDEVEDGDSAGREGSEAMSSTETRPYFEVLVVDAMSPEEEADFRMRMLELRRDEDEFVYDVVVVNSFEGALIASLFNHNIQSCVVRYDFPFETDNPVTALRQYLALFDKEVQRAAWEQAPGGALARALHSLRPELDLFQVTDDAVEDVTLDSGMLFRRIFFHHEDMRELHLSILKGIRERYETPFFNALREYSQKPTGVFHALPISRGKSITRSHWIQDMGLFYGPNIFLAETSATSGGLDSLLQPLGPLKDAQASAARAFGAQHTFFVTNGTSTANKIVMQALVQPGDLVLVSHDCHKSHHYSLVLSGAYPVYMDAYPLSEYSIFGAVTLHDIKRTLLDLRAAGKLHKVRMLLLTNCTFDGVVYDPERIMREVLAIKPDMIFVWDEAWFAFARCMPSYRGRTAMESTQKLKDELRTDEYRARYDAWRAGFDADDDQAWLSADLLPDPDTARLRVYATHSTHKTLTSLRQGSMIHVYDQDYETLARDAFHEAYMTHTSTSPNYQILASLDVGRRQVELEGYEMVKKSVNLAMTLREQIEEQPLLNRYLRVLKVRDMIPEAHRPSGLEEFYSPESGYARLEQAWQQDEFALDPTRLTLHIGRTGMDGDTLRKLLADRYDIQINKTSRNTVLFMLNIGTSRGSVAYLLKVLTSIVQDLDERAESETRRDRARGQLRVSSLVERTPPLPHFSHFHAAFKPVIPGAHAGATDTPEGDLRQAFYLAYDEENCTYVPLEEVDDHDEELVSANFVIPYPPGFPVRVPGQVVSQGIVDYLQALDVKEIHGLRSEYGLRVFTAEALASQARPTPPLTTGAPTR